MNIVDSSGWLEYFADTVNAKNFEKIIEDIEQLLVPSITIFEVFKKILTEKNEHTALKVVAHMKLGSVIDLDTEISLQAGKFSHELKIPMADSIIYATAKKYNAQIYTQDRDFKGLDLVQYFEKK